MADNKGKSKPRSPKPQSQNSGGRSTPKQRLVKRIITDGARRQRTSKPTH